jgi:hypothetical protein
MMLSKEVRAEALGVNILEAQENKLSPVLKQRQAPVHNDPSGFCFIIIFTL